MKLNIGCGRHVLEGWTNVDVARSPKAPRDPEIFADARKVPLGDKVAHELMAIHVLEHFYKWEVQDVLAEWRRLLRVGGRLVLELPNLALACRNLLSGQGGDQMSMWPIYGDPGHKDPLMCHRWGWTPSTLMRELLAAGFSNVRERKPQWHGARVDRDMRLEAIRT